MTEIALPPPSLRLTVDRAALAANWQALDRLSGAAAAGAAVKAMPYAAQAPEAAQVAKPPAETAAPAAAKK